MKTKNKLLLLLCLTVKRNVLSVLVVLSLLVAACGTLEEEIVESDTGEDLNIANTFTGADAKIWTQVPISIPANNIDLWSGRSEHATVVFDDKTETGPALYIIGGSGDKGLKNDVWRSTDGRYWTLIAAQTRNGEANRFRFSARKGHSVVVFNGAMWVIGGEEKGLRLNDVWRSPDGVNWYQIRANDEKSKNIFDHRYKHSSVVFDGAMWVIGGYHAWSGKNDVWKSKDGKNWTLMTSAAFSEGRFDHASVVFNDGTGDAMWVIGGRGSYENLSDVWRSTDGRSWTRRSIPYDERFPNETKRFSPRMAHDVAVYGKALWLIGGYSGAGGYNNSYFRNDVWKSTNGINWTEELFITSPYTTIPGRAGHTATVFKNELFVIGGHDLNNYYSDVWVKNPDKTRR